MTTVEAGHILLALFTAVGLAVLVCYIILATTRTDDD